MLRICLAAAPGGHLVELLNLRGAYADFPHFFVLNESSARVRDPQSRVYWVPDYGRGGRVRRGCALVRLSLDSVRIWWLERPNVLLSTGPFTGFPLALLVRATGGRVIYIECSAQVMTPSRSGRLFRWIAHRLYVQWPSLQAHYPKAEYRGPLL